MEAGDEAHHVPVGQRCAPLATRKHAAHVSQLEQQDNRTDRVCCEAHQRQKDEILITSRSLIPHLFPQVFFNHHRATENLLY